MDLGGNNPEVYTQSQRRNVPDISLYFAVEEGRIKLNNLSKEEIARNLQGYLVEYYTQKRVLNFQELLKSELRDIAALVPQYYELSWFGVQKDLGIAEYIDTGEAQRQLTLSDFFPFETDDNNRIAWQQLNDEDFKLAMQAFMSSYVGAGGVLTSRSLEKDGYGSVIQQVYLRYPGSLTQLKNDLYPEVVMYDLLDPRRYVNKINNHGTPDWQNLTAAERHGAMYLWARQVVLAGHSLKEATFRTIGQNGMWGRIQRDFPGGITGLQELLQKDPLITSVSDNSLPVAPESLINISHYFPLTDQQQIDWESLSEDEIKQKVQNFVKDYISQDPQKRFTKSGLITDGLRAVATRLGKVYPGSWKQLLIDTGIVDMDSLDALDPKRFFSKFDTVGILWQEIPKEEWEDSLYRWASHFAEEYGEINSKKIREVGYPSLDVQISKNFPGGIVKLREKLILERKLKAQVVDITQPVLPLNTYFPVQPDGKIPWQKLSNLTIHAGLYGWARDYVSQGLPLNAHYLSNHGYRGLAKKIPEVFPDGFEGLKFYLRRDGYLPEEKPTVSSVRTTFEESLAQFASVEDFFQFINRFGIENQIDILTAYVPGFGKLSLDEQGSIISEYIGEAFIATEGMSFNDQTLEFGEIIPFLEIENLKMGVVRTLQEQFGNFLIEEKQSSVFESEAVSIQRYIVQIREQAILHESLPLTEIADLLEKRLKNIEACSIPSSMKQNITLRWPQKVAVTRALEEERFLDASEPGSGKSLAAITVKEKLYPNKTALIVTPSNVETTWQEYLSDVQEGYFSEGDAPRVLRIRSPEDITILNAQNDASSHFDYIIISHSKLANKEYIDALSNQPLQMLIVDEVHKSKRVKGGKQAEGLLSLSEKVYTAKGHNLLLSGTPVPNNLSDTVILYKLLFPELYQSVPPSEIEKSLSNDNIIRHRAQIVRKMHVGRLEGHVNILPYHEQEIVCSLNKQEEAIYNLIREDETLTPFQKIDALRRICLFPGLIGLDNDVPSSKIEAINKELNMAFGREEKKIILFVNNYKQLTTRKGNHDIQTLADQLQIPQNCELRFIDGDTAEHEKESIKASVNADNGKSIVLVAIGQAVDVGESFVGADTLCLVNPGWTRFERRQQIGRAQRPGRKRNLRVVDFITEHSIEEGILRHAQAKELIIYKLLYGIPFSEIEAKMADNLVNSELMGSDIGSDLVKSYISARERLNYIFSRVKGMGEAKFNEQVVLPYGQQYAESYAQLGSFSYQADVNRMVGRICDEIISMNNLHNPQILDAASGPAMLERYRCTTQKADITSLDIIPQHFNSSSDARHIVGSYNNIPALPESYDVVCHTLSLHQTEFSPKGQALERIHTLLEAKRVLRVGGHLVISLPYSVDWKNPENFNVVIEKLGFQVVAPLSGVATHGMDFKSRVVTLKKIETMKDNTHENILSEEMSAFDIVGTDDHVIKSDRMMSTFKLQNRSYIITLNERDQQLWQDARAIRAKFDNLKTQAAGNISQVSREDLRPNQWKVRIGGRYKLYGMVGDKEGMVVVDSDEEYIK